MSRSLFKNMNPRNEWFRRIYVLVISLSPIIRHIFDIVNRYGTLKPLSHEGSVSQSMSHPQARLMFVLRSHEHTLQIITTMFETMTILRIVLSVIFVCNVCTMSVELHSLVWLRVGSQAGAGEGKGAIKRAKSTIATMLLVFVCN